ncbi:bifunctional metallophosphatase/5'-nucleotidase [Kutzneria albida]|uniref:5prime nucleotidase n=1 Tax=Kutzneria albida DSM 43870 TaxID=1449976 RepID=W5W5S9_9PSEU|nr:bifunctional metallophosphatase/5'-nucleotidase [Kutzneria albida]AHH93554.1 5prime nucleotidase [Kutzneria albida DSM 43870]
MTVTRRLGALAVTTAAALALSGTAAIAAPDSHQPRPVSIRLIGMNDFHGNLEPPAGSSGKVTLSDGTSVLAGGAAYLATHVKQLRAQAPNSLLFSAGDNVGASPLASALFHDEPTIDFFNQIGVRASAVGNHELDKGYQELVRKQFGGCSPVDGCQFEKTFPGAKWPYLAANMTFDNGLPAALPFTVDFSGGVPVGVIGVPLKDLPLVTSAEAIKGLKFGDEVQAINRSADLLDRLGVKSIVVLLHQGDSTEGGGPNDCRETPGAALAIAQQASPKVDVIFSGHSHQQYNCVVKDPAGNPRPLIQGASFGRLLSVVDIKVDPRTRDVIRAQTVAHNEIVTRDVVPDPAAKALVDSAVAKAAPIANKAVGTVASDVVAAQNAAGESALGDVIGDAQLDATKSAGAQVALMNPGGIRADLVFKSTTAGVPDGTVTYANAFTVQPFANILQTVTLTGAQLKAVLEQQWQPQPNGTVQVKMLQVSSSLHYTWSASAPVGSKVSAITVAGQPVQPDATYKVTANNFLTGGGDGFSVLKSGTNTVGGAIDLDAFTGYLTAHQNLAPPAADRITRVS